MLGDGSAVSLVGRAHELDVGRQLLDAALGGTPQVLIVRGEVGIGKSRLTRAITDEARQRGALVLWGAGQEELSLPYLPISMALSTLTADAPALIETDALAAEPDPARLWTRVEQALLRALSERAVVLVIDDLQWADPASQALLLHLLVLLDHASSSRRVEVLTVLTVRTPVGADRSARTLARLEREPNTTSLTLHGLSRAEVRQLLGQLGPAPPSAALVQRVVEASGGNPLLAAGIVHTGLEDRRLRVVGGSLVAGPDDPLTVSLTTFDRSISTRLDRLSPACRELLTTAAFLGEPQGLEALAELTDLAPEVVEDLVEEAADAEVLQERDGQLVFTHPQVRHVLFHSPARRARQRRHLELGDRLEAGDRGPDAAAIAHHLARAGPEVDPARLARWSQLAAEQALALGAWADAGIAAGQALDALGEGAPWTQRADLHALVSRAASHDFDLALASHHGERAVALAKEHGDTSRWCAALVPLARTLATNAGDAEVVDPSPLLLDFLTANPEAEPAVRAEVLALLSEIRAAQDDTEAAVEAAREAGALLQADSEPELVSAVAFADGMARWARLDLAGGRAGFELAQRVGEPTAGARSRTYAAVRLALTHHLLGDTDRAEQIVRDLGPALADRQVWGEHALLLAAAASTAVARGQLDRAEALVESAELSISRSSFTWTRLIAQPALAHARALRGDGRGAVEAIERSGVGPGTQARYALAIDAVLGDRDRVRREVARRPWRPPGPVPTLRDLPALALHAEVAFAIDDAAMADQALPPLQVAYEAGVRLSTGWVSQLSRLLAGCHLATGDAEAATRWLDAARLEAIDGARPVELARLALAEARLAQRDPEGGAEIGSLARAASEALDDVGALPLAAEARRLGRLDTTTSGPTRRAILFTDLVGSTELNVRTGDAAWVELVREHDDIVRRCLRRHAGVEFKHTGDGIAAWFSSPADAVDCAVEMGRDLDQANTRHPDVPLQMRAGITIGEPVGHGGDLFGLTVVHASRLCDVAEDGSVLVSDEVAQAARSARRVFHNEGTRTLKGFPEPVVVHRVVHAARGRAQG